MKVHATAALAAIIANLMTMAVDSKKTKRNANTVEEVSTVIESEPVTTTTSGALETEEGAMSSLEQTTVAVGESAPLALEPDTIPFTYKIDCQVNVESGKQLALFEECVLTSFQAISNRHLSGKQADSVRNTNYAQDFVTSTEVSGLTTKTDFFGASVRRHLRRARNLKRRKSTSTVTSYITSTLSDNHMTTETALSDVEGGGTIYRMITPTIEGVSYDYDYAELFFAFHAFFPEMTVDEIHATISVVDPSLFAQTPQVPLTDAEVQALVVSLYPEHSYGEGDSVPDLWRRRLEEEENRNDQKQRELAVHSNLFKAEFVVDFSRCIHGGTQDLFPNAYIYVECDGFRQAM